MNKTETQQVLAHLNLKPRKKYGQNFIIDDNILRKIITVSELSNEDVVLEVGAGLGALTKEIARKAKHLYAYEIDPILYHYLTKKFANFTNVKLIHEDILKAKIPRVNKVISNIPYSITGPVFEKVLFTENPLLGVFIIERSIAERIFNVNNYRTFSRITLSFNAFMKPIKTIKISRSCFYPAPKIDLALIIAKSHENLHPSLTNQRKRLYFLQFSAGIMPYKNKNILNALDFFLQNTSSPKIKKEEIKKLLQENNLRNTKVTEFEIEDLIGLSEIIFNFIKS